MQLELGDIIQINSSELVVSPANICNNIFK